MSRAADAPKAGLCIAIFEASEKGKILLRDAPSSSLELDHEQGAGEAILECQQEAEFSATATVRHALLRILTATSASTAYRENIPPGSAGKAAAASESTTRGLPYYEKLRRDLRDTLQKKRILDKNMAALEEQIYRQETSYLEETSTAGNIIKGFDNYIKSSAISGSSSAAGAGGGGSGHGAGTISGSAAGGGGGPATGRRKPVINDTDRVFSRSSTAYMRDSDSPSSATTTPNHAGTATPTGKSGQFGGAERQGCWSGSGSG
ncbi:hypothetical protein GJ744_005054 [Endocarpon pusillum]|uniref:Chromatin modification-related protein EAF6 n=1 Tax=Endocarpon pusillum TaxID=364733 RepID=A0A8H7DYX0_9EURO|nr:hypothetical protein GJ744_005054 [Endocarpon pusillum]